MPASSSMDIQVISTTTIHPSIRKDELTSTPLSIFDNVSADYARCAAAWFYTPSSHLTPSHLHESLSKTLSYYPQWCGRLSYITPKPKGNHNERYQRIWVTYNATSDPGVPFITATSPKPLSTFLPSTATRKDYLKAWDGNQLPSSDLLPDTNLAKAESPDAPSMIIQFTTFSCGSMAIAIEITHCLADAVSMNTFAKDWARTSKAMLSGSPLPILSPIFDPQLLDRAAAGDIDAEQPDTDIVMEARRLPMHRHDWYKPVEGQPWPADIPDDLPKEGFSESEPIPWHQWDTKAPISHRVLHFSAPEIQNVYLSATQSSGGMTGTRISKHDALLGHIWSRINASRNLKPGTKTYLDMTFGLRPRVNPPLPDTFLGSPITHAAVSSLIPESLSDYHTQSAKSLAQNIRNTLIQFTPSTIGALLHDRAFEIAPERLWSTCLGSHYVLLTTWIHSGVYDVDFGTGRPVYVEAIMPACDGLVEVMEAPGEDRYREGGRWDGDGVDVSVYLEAGAMERLVRDETLWGGELK